MTATAGTSLPSAIPRVQYQGHTPPENQDGSSTVPSPSPKLRLHINDLRHSATRSFLSHIPDPHATLETALSAIITHLYTVSSSEDKKTPCFTPSIPPTRSVTLILHDFPGIAYTTGTDLDDDHKEIHLSLSYIRTCAGYNDPARELAGVLTHELVHCYQHTAPSSDDAPRPPGGLVEGIADFVRLKACFDPPHWKRPGSAKDRPQNWDQGYQHTAFFLAWLEDVRVGAGAVGMLNDRLRTVGYVGEYGDGGSSSNGFWKGLFGTGVLELWDEYGRYLDAFGQSGIAPGQPRHT